MTGDPATIDELLAQSADHTIAWVQGQWKQANLVDASKQSTMTVEVPVTSLRQWVDIKKQLGGVPSLKSVRMTSLTRTLAVLEIGFVGDLAQFQRSLAQQDLSLATAIGDSDQGHAAPGCQCQRQPAAAAGAAAHADGPTGSAGLRTGGARPAGRPAISAHDPRHPSQGLGRRRSSSSSRCWCC